MRKAAIIAALAVIPTLAEAATVTRARYLMGTVCEVAARGKGVQAGIERAFGEARRIESMLSTWIADSELSRLNRGETEPSPELSQLLNTATAWSEKTQGTFDPRWREKIAGAKVDRPQYEAGAFGKGYALDRMLALVPGEVTINFGGQIVVRGSTSVTIAHPEHRDRSVLALRLTNGSLSTSSSSEQPGHIFDPRTGQPLPARGSVSVIADDALTADILSTALYVMGEDDGLRWADANGVAAIFINPSHDVRLSARARERARGLTLMDRNFSLKD